MKKKRKKLIQDLWFSLFFPSFYSYGIFSFGLIFLVEGRGILQATLTLNGLVGGILLGLFSLGIFFKKANVKVCISVRYFRVYIFEIATDILELYLSL